MSENNGSEEKFSFMADNETAPRVITIKIPVGRLVDSEADGYARLLGYMHMYSNQLESLFHLMLQTKNKSKIVVPGGLPPPGIGPA